MMADKPQAACAAHRCPRIAAWLVGNEAGFYLYVMSDIAMPVFWIYIIIMLNKLPTNDLLLIIDYMWMLVPPPG
jgi:hypothetical protein